MAEPSNFVYQIVSDDIAAGKNAGRVVTRVPPEPNGYLHIGHAKSICLNFGLAEAFGGTCFLRFDDTNPAKEDREFIDAIERDVRWLGFDWGEHRSHASDYFEQLYEMAEQLVMKGLAYVDSQDAETMRATRGTLTAPGVPSPYRDRTPAQSLDLLRRMRAGEFPDGAHVLRAKIDMASPNITLRDPAMYRIVNAPHPMTGDAWHIYPMYDFAHGQCDALEQVTHSVCTLEFEDHRPLYDWFVEHLGFDPAPRQYEFSRLNLTYTLMSKRLLTQLVREGHVSGWDDPRLPTVSGMRRRGFTPASVRSFCAAIGVTRKDAVIDLGVLEGALRSDLDATAPRAMAVLRPVRLVVTNWPADGEEGAEDWLDAPNHPQDEGQGRRQIPFSRELYIEQEDFADPPPSKYRRLTPGKEVRLRYGYIVRCTGAVRDEATGEVLEVHCEYDPATRGGDTPDGRKIKGTIHWVSAKHAVSGEARLYDRLFTRPDPWADDRPLPEQLNEGALEVCADAKFEPGLATLTAGTQVQFERLGYFTPDLDGTPARPVFNRAVSLRDSWGK